MTDPVQSIRVASALVERFGVLARTPQHNFYAGSVEQTELRIGEAQQIYPEIWRHLGDAYAALVARGVKVPRFEELRAGDHAHVGVTDVDVVTYDTRAVSKTATFNWDGHQRAVAACQVLMAAMPEVDWATLAMQDRQMEATSLRSPARTWIVIAVVAAVGAALLYAMR